MVIEAGRLSLLWRLLCSCTEEEVTDSYQTFSSNKLIVIKNNVDSLLTRNLDYSLKPMICRLSRIMRGSPAQSVGCMRYTECVKNAAEAVLFGQN